MSEARASSNGVFLFWNAPMHIDGVIPQPVPTGRYAVYFLIGTPDLLNDAQVQVVVRRDPADAAFAVDAQQSAVLGPFVAGRCVERSSSSRRRDRRILQYSSSFLHLCHGGRMATASGSVPDGNRHSHSVGRAQ